MTLDAAAVSRLDDVAVIAYGRGVPAAERTSDGFPYVTSAGTHGFTSSALVAADVVVVGRKGSVGKVHAVYGGCSPSDTTFYVAPKTGDLVVGFLALLLESANLATLEQSSAVPGLSRDRLAAVPVPSCDVRAQRRIVDLLAAAGRAIKGAELLVAEAVAFRSALLEELVPLHGVGMRTTLRSILKSRVVPHQPLLGAEYKQITLAIRGKGARLRGVAPGAALIASRQFIAHPGDLIVSKIDARNGALALIPDSLGAALVTADFPMFELNKRLITPRYADLLVRSPRFAAMAAAVSSGTTNRVRLDVERFLDLEVSLPPVTEQERVSAVLNAVDAYLASAEVRLTSCVAARDQLLHDLLSGNHNIPVSYDRFLEQDPA